MALCTPTVRLSSLVTWCLMRIVFPSLLPALAMLCVASMGKMGRKDLCSQPGRMAAEPQHPNVTPVSWVSPFSCKSIRKDSSCLYMMKKKPSLPFTCTPGVLSAELWICCFFPQVPRAVREFLWFACFLGHGHCNSLLSSTCSIFSHYWNFKVCTFLAPFARNGFEALVVSICTGGVKAVPQQHPFFSSVTVKLNFGDSGLHF